MKITTTTIAGLLACVVAGPAAAISIDEFDGNQATTSTGTSFDGSMLGGERDVSTGADSSFSLGGGQITINSLTGIAGTNIYYDGDDDDPTSSFGLGGLDLTVGGADRFLVSVTDVSSNFSITLRAHESAGNSIRSGPQTLAAGATGIYEFTFDSFSFVTGAGANLNNVNLFEVIVSDNTSSASGGPGTITLDYIRTNGVVDAAISEPSTVLSLATGLIALGAWRRKRTARRGVRNASA